MIEKLYELLASVIREQTPEQTGQYVIEHFDVIRRCVLDTVSPEMESIPPDKFIPLLEKEGRIYPVDQYIWEEACKFLYERKVRGMKLVTVSVNLARADLYQANLLLSLGCHYAQGYLYGKPEPAQKFWNRNKSVCRTLLFRR